MQSRYMRAILALPETAVHLLERVFCLPRAGNLFHRLVEAGVDHAQATLTLLYNGHYEGVEILIGHPVVICPPCLSGMHISTASNMPTPPRSVDETRVIRSISDNPRLPTTPSFNRFEQLKLGMTVQQALTRGVTRRDIREWEREGSIRVEKTG